MDTSLMVPFCIYHPDSPPNHVIESLLCLPDNQTIATGSRSGQICLWSVVRSPNPPSHTYPSPSIHSPSSSPHTSPSPTSHASPSHSPSPPSSPSPFPRASPLLSPPTRLFPRFLLFGHKSAICALGHIPYNSLPYALVSCTVDGSLRVWDPEDGKCLKGANNLLSIDSTKIPEVLSSDARDYGIKVPFVAQFRYPRCVSIFSICYSSSSRNLVALQMFSGTIFIVDISDFFVICKLVDCEPIVCMTTISISFQTINAQESILATASATGHLKFWRVHSVNSEPVFQHFETKPIRRRGQTKRASLRNEVRIESRQEQLRESMYEVSNAGELEMNPSSLSFSPNNVFVVIGFPHFFTIYLCTNMKPLLTVDLEPLPILSSREPGEQAHSIPYQMSIAEFISYSSRNPTNFDLDSDSILNASFSYDDIILVQLQSGNSVSYQIHGIHPKHFSSLVSIFRTESPYTPTGSHHSFKPDPFVDPFQESIYATPQCVYLKPPTKIDDLSLQLHVRGVRSATNSQFLVVGDFCGIVYLWDFKAPRNEAAPPAICEDPPQRENQSEPEKKRNKSSFGSNGAAASGVLDVPHPLPAGGRHTQPGEFTAASDASSLLVLCPALIVFVPLTQPAPSSSRQRTQK